MTRRVLVSHSLPELRSGNRAIDDWVAQHLQRHIAEVFEQISFLTPEDGDFTAVVAGSSTAGTYEIGNQYSRYYRIGDFVVANVDIRLAGAITGGGTGDLYLTGLPLAKLADYLPVGQVFLAGVNWTAGANLSCGFVDTATEGTTLVIRETNDNAADSLVPISAVAASDVIIASICYITSGERSE